MIPLSSYTCKTIGQLKTTWCTDNFSEQAHATFWENLVVYIDISLDIFLGHNNIL